MAKRTSASLLIVLAMVAGCAPQVQPRPARPWPVEGQCLPTPRRTEPCVQVTAADVAEIQHTILALPSDRSGNNAIARTMAAGRITELAIGRYLIEAYDSENPAATDVLRLVAVEPDAPHAANVVQTSHRVVIVTVGRVAGAWSVLEVDRRDEDEPQLTRR